MQGLVTSAIDPTVALLGASIDTSLIPESGFLGRYGVIGRSAFFSGLSSGKKVGLRGTALGDTDLVGSFAARVAAGRHAAILPGFSFLPHPDVSSLLLLVHRFPEVRLS